MRSILVAAVFETAQSKYIMQYSELGVRIFSLHITYSEFTNSKLSWCRPKHKFPSKQSLRACLGSPSMSVILAHPLDEQVFWFNQTKPYGSSLQPSLMLALIEYPNARRLQNLGTCTHNPADQFLWGIDYLNTRPRYVLRFYRPSWHNCFFTLCLDEFSIKYSVFIIY